MRNKLNEFLDTIILESTTTISFTIASKTIKYLGINLKAVTGGT